MSLKKERVHTTGFSNIDFRTKNDSNSLLLFQPWKVAEHYGTINDYGYRLSVDEHKKILSDLGIITDNYDVRTKFEEIREFYDLVCQELNVTNIKV